MGVELPIRFRCDGCGIILELPRLVQGLKWPLVLHNPQLGGQIAQPPSGWWQDGDRLFCPAHQPEKRIEVAPAGAVIAIDAMRKARKLN